MKLVAVQLGQDVVNVENDPCTGQLRQPRREDEEVRDVMNMHDVIRPAEVANGNQGMFAYKISAFSPGSLRFNGSFQTQRPAEDRRETPRLLKLVDSLSCDN